MLTVTHNAYHEKLSVGDEDIVLTGPPGELRGILKISNKNDEPLRIKSLGVISSGKKGALSATASMPLKFSFRLQPGEEKMGDIAHQLPLHTAPGTYESSVVVGGATRKLKIIVQALIDIDIYPTNFSFLGAAPGKKHEATFTVTNTGNLPFQVPEVKHVTTLDMDFFCRALSLAIRDKGQEGYTPMMDELTKNIQKDMSGWVAVAIKETGNIIAPGETTTLTLHITLPNDMDAKKDYAGNIRFWDKEITYVIKSHLEKVK
jgi:hypothetical protein